MDNQPPPRTEGGLRHWRGRQWAVPLLIALLSFLWFWTFRANIWTGGDSEQWEREIHGGIWLRRRQMLSFATFQLAFQLFHPLLGWTAHLAMNLVSSLAGALAMVFGWFLVRDLPHRRWAFAILATGGYTALFYGHIETYAQPAAVFFLHLLSLKRVLEGRWPLWTVCATYSLFLWFHLLILFALPAFALFLAHRAVVGRHGLVEWRRAAIALLPGVLCWVVVSRFSLGEGELVGTNFVAPWREMILSPWVLFTHGHVPTKFGFAFHTGGITAALVPLIGWGMIRRGGVDRFSAIVLVYLGCFLGKTLIWHPDMAETDWDLFAFPWILTTVLAAFHVMALPGRAVWVGLILGAQVFLLITRPIQWAEIDQRATARLVVRMEEAPPGTRVLLDDRVVVERPLRKIRRGGHTLRVMIPGGGAPVHRAFHVRGGESFLLMIEGDRVTLREEPRGNAPAN